MSGLDGKGSNFPKGLAVGPGSGQTLALSVLIGSANITPAAILTNAGASATLTVTGAVLGKYVVNVIAPGDLLLLTATAYVSALNTVTIKFFNGTAGTVTPPAGVYTVQCVRVVA